MKTVVLDIGGTAIKSAVYFPHTAADAPGMLQDLRECPTEAKRGGPHVVRRVKEIISDYRREYEIGRIGISTAGQVDPAAGKIIYANENIPEYTGTELVQILEQEFGIPAAVENDVNAAAIGEARFGAGRGWKEFVCLTYGTGVGGAIFTGGRLYHGSSCSAGEFGGIVTHPEHRNPAEDLFSGCYERYASTTALVEHARAFDPALDTGRKIFARIAEPEVRSLIDEWVMEIVCGLTTIIHMLNPAGVILGGGVMEQEYVLDAVRRHLYENIMPSFRHVELRKAELGNRAGLLGAAMLVTE